MTAQLEKTLWATADKLRNNMDAAEYKHVVLGLIFLKYISDSFEELYEKLKNEKHSDPEDKDEYLAENVFYVPPSARWNYLQHQRAKIPSVGKDLDDAMEAIEKDNPSLKGVLPKDYARPALDKRRLGELVDLGLDFREYAFYTALEVNDSAVSVLGDEVLRHIARELVDTVRKNTSIDWTVSENVQAKMRIAAKKILRKHGYPPDMEVKATETVIEQAKLMVY
jgi:type I restriction-modification system DNA methylase subunit